MPRLEIARVIRNTPISDRLWWCQYDAPGIAAAARPGQFAHVLCGPGDVYDPMLRRPLSFSRIEPDTGRVALLIETLTESADIEVVQDITRAIQLSTCFEGMDKRSVLGKIVKTRPEIQEFITGGEILGLPERGLEALVGTPAARPGDAARG